jgi:uncharacterized membrane protein YjfL (UPF0719 family)
MADPFTSAIQFLDSIGFFKFLIPYILTSAIFYGLLRRSKIFGEKSESVAINATISLSAALLVTASPILVGIDLSKPLSQFLSYSLIVFIVVLVIVFIPLLVWQEQFLKKVAENKKVAILMTIIIISVAVLTAIFIFYPLQISLIYSSEILTAISALLILFILLLIVFFPSKKT